MIERRCPCRPLNWRFLKIPVAKLTDVQLSKAINRSDLESFRISNGFIKRSEIVSNGFVTKKTGQSLKFIIIRHFFCVKFFIFRCFFVWFWERKRNARLKRFFSVPSVQLLVIYHIVNKTLG